MSTAQALAPPPKLLTGSCPGERTTTPTAGSHDEGSSSPGRSWPRPLSTAACEATGSAFQASKVRPPSATDAVMEKSVIEDVTQVGSMPSGPITLATAWLMLNIVDDEAEPRPK